MPRSTTTSSGRLGGDQLIIRFGLLRPFARRCRLRAFYNEWLTAVSGLG